MVERTGYRSQYNTTHALCMLARATNTHSDYVVFLLFDGNSGYSNAPQCYVIRTLQPVLLLPRRSVFTAR